MKYVVLLVQVLELIRDVCVCSCTVTDGVGVGRSHDDNGEYLCIIKHTLYHN